MMATTFGECIGANLFQPRFIANRNRGGMQNAGWAGCAIIPRSQTLLGLTMCWYLCCGTQKQSFADKCVPKQSLGTRVARRCVSHLASRIPHLDDKIAGAA